MNENRSIVPLLDDHDRAELIERFVSHGYTDLATSVVGQGEFDDDRLKEVLLEIDAQYAEHLYHKTLRKVNNA